MGPIIETIKGKIEAVVGRKDRVFFRSEVDELMRRQGFPLEVAQKHVAEKYLSALSLEFDRQGSLFSDSSIWKNISGMMDETLYPNLRERVTQWGNSPTVLRRLPPYNPTAGQINFLAKQIVNKFQVKNPTTLMLRDMYLDMRGARELAERFNSDLRSNLNTGSSLADMVSSNPSLGADLGALLELKKRISANERRLSNDHNFEKELENLKEKTKEAIFGIFLKMPFEWAVSAWKSFPQIIKQQSIAPIGKFFVEALGSLAKNGKVVGQVILSGVKVLKGLFSK